MPPWRTRAFASTIERVDRLIVMWLDPMHLTRGEGEAWVREETGRLLAFAGIERLELARLDRASGSHSRAWDWLLEVRLSSDAGWVEEPLFTEWLADLRLLGMRPVVLRVCESTVLSRDGG